MLAAIVPAQMGGSRAGLNYEGGVGDLPLLERKVAESFIAIDGRAEVRVPPTALRVVLAVTAEAESAEECQKVVDETTGRIKDSWFKLGIQLERIHADFIAVLPRYEWLLEKRGQVEVGMETKVGYRMQTNLHLAVENEEQAKQALALAYAQGVTDIIAFDYLNENLDTVQIEARRKAIEAAQAKAEMLLALFPERPGLMNIQERTEVHFPESMYESFSNAYEETPVPNWRRDVSFLRAFRPKNTYYRGLDSESDSRPAELPMRPEISVVSTVRLYFESPLAKEEKVE